MADRCGGGVWLWLTWLSLTLAGCSGQCSGNKPNLRQAEYTVDSVIYSPGYPNNYPDQVDCAWIISAQRGYVVRVTVDWLDMENDQLCNYDNLSIYDGGSRDNPLLCKLCGRVDKADFYSSGDHAYVSFHSDHSISDRGFRLEFTAVPVLLVPPTTNAWRPTLHPPGTSTIGPTTTSGNDEWQRHVNTTALVGLIGGVAGGIILLLVFCTLCRYYHGRNARGGGGAPRGHNVRGGRPSEDPSTSSTTAVFQNNNAVFVVSSPSVNGGSGGVGSSHYAPPPNYYSASRGDGRDGHSPSTPPQANNSGSSRCHGNCHVNGAHAALNNCPSGAGHTHHTCSSGRGVASYANAHTTSFINAHINYAFAPPSGEAPPAYFALQDASNSIGSSVVLASGFGGGSAGVRGEEGRGSCPLNACPLPPTYNETMLLTHPPAVSACHRPPPPSYPPPPPPSCSPPPAPPHPSPPSYPPPPLSPAPLHNLPHHLHHH